MKLKLFTVKELQAKKVADIEKYIVDLKGQYSELLHQLKINKSKQTAQLGQIKKALAQAYTIKTQVAGEEGK